ncbi:hypothetical protein BZA05DRAFT_220374 [Tricharina praecox]|uniref:uncharacterized protein n=1 Tax=Tricharina praecox TaxID=43433 RepID=UPI00221EB801|nr:uncharacterized protein BZA05DRAFT_220374 [Tricharina praecox]KAI5855897.1 hypothetical protein BZA05DRAFT_220374 [Tricharina praecox]
MNVTLQAHCVLSLVLPSLRMTTSRRDILTLPPTTATATTTTSCSKTLQINQSCNHKVTKNRRLEKRNIRSNSQTPAASKQHTNPAQNKSTHIKLPTVGR